MATKLSNIKVSLLLFWILCSSGSAQWFWGVSAFGSAVSQPIVSVPLHAEFNKGQTNTGGQNNGTRKYSA
eukprot:2277507-Amphidinium_carterae.1